MKWERVLSQLATCLWNRQWPIAIYDSPQRKRGGACNRKVHPRLHQTAITVQLVPSLQVKKLSFLEFLQNTLMLRLHKCQLENRLLSSNACASISCDMREYWLRQRGWDE